MSNSSEFEKTVLEKLNKLDNLEKRFDNFEGRFEKLEERFDNFGGRFEKLEEHFDNFEKKLEIMEVKQNALKELYLPPHPRSNSGIEYTTRNAGLGFNSRIETKVRKF